MSVSYSNALKNTRSTAVITALDAQSGNATLEICSAAYASVLAIVPLNKPSWAVSGGAGLLTMQGVPVSCVSAGNSGTAALARLKDSAGTVWIQSLTCGVGSGDIQLNSLSITAGQTVTITSATITPAA